MRQSSLSALLCANYHRLEAVDASQSETSVYPPPQFEPYERLLTATTEEIAEIHQQKDVQQDDTLVERAASPPATVHIWQRPNTQGNPQSQLQAVVDVCSFEEREPKEAVIEFEEEKTHSREVSVYETLHKQFENNNSGFLEYISVFFGHLKGIIDELKAFILGRIEKRKNKKKIIQY